MAGRKAVFLLIILIAAFGIIHLGVGIGITVKYRQYADVMVQSVGLAGFNIILGVFGIVVAILGVFSVIAQKIGKVATIAALVLGVFVFASLIAALALNGQAIGYIRAHLSYRINSYSSIDDSIGVVDAIQTNYQCCGEYLWLDWADVALGAATSSGSGTGIGTGTVAGRRRRSFLPQSSLLAKAIRRRRQTSIGSTSNLYGLPSSYSINLPLSCCKGGSGASTGTNTIGGYCLFNAGNSSNSFYVGGCIVPVSNVVVSQITGIAVINVFLTILAFVFVPVLIRSVPVFNDSNDKQSGSNEMQQQQEQQQQQYSYGGYYTSNTDPNAYYTYPTAMNNAPMYGGPAYMTYQ